MLTSGATLDERIVKVNKFQIINFQLKYYCWFTGIKLNDTEMTLLTYMGEWGKMRMTLFAEKACKEGVLSTPQAVLTCLTKLVHTDLFVKDGVGKKKIFLNPKLKIQTEGSIVFSVKLVHKSEAIKTTGAVSSNSRKTELA